MNDDKLILSASKSDALCTPRKDYVPQPVKTLRDEFAMAALTGMAVNGGLLEELVITAYKVADAMLRVREEQ